MSPLVRKEIRLLLPAWIAAMLLALSNLLLPADTRGLREVWYALPFILCPAVGIFLVLESFGREFSSNTFSNLLAQPVSRQSIWRAKTVLTFVAVTLVLLVWWWAFILGSPASPRPKEIHEMMLITGIYALTFYAGGLWTILLFRQVAVAFWFVLLAPGLLIVMLTGVWEIQHKPAGDEIIVGAMVVYAMVSFLFARRLFLRAQDVQWTGGVIAFPSWVKLPGRAAAVGPPARRPLMALITKEIHLHQAEFVMAGVLALLHLGVVLLRHFAPALANRYALMDVLYKCFWALWLVMPLLIGCGAVAEERRVGTLEAQLCLPARRRTQFVIKFAVAFGIAMLLGAVVPYLFEGHRILPEMTFRSDGPFSEASLAHVKQFAGSSWLILWIRLVLVVREILPALVLCGISALLVSAAFYASSLARNTLQALAPGVLGFVVAAMLLLNAHTPEAAFGYALWRGPLIYLIGLPVLGVTLVWLTFWNFKCVNTGWVVWRRNIFAVLGALAFVMAVTTATYQRVWEFLAPMESAHGPARFAKGGSARFEAINFKVLTELPDGHTRFDTFMPSASGVWSTLTGDYQLRHLANRSRIEEGTNWLDVVDCVVDQAWLRNDGSLWVPEKPQPMTFYMTNIYKMSASRPSPLVRKGQDNDWKRIVGMGGLIVLLKRDGSLWQLGEPPGKGWQTNWPGLIGFEPKRIGTNSDWVDLFSINQQLCLRKKDGSLWSEQVFTARNTSGAPMIVADWLKLYPASYLGDGKWKSISWVNVPRAGGTFVGVRDSGAFWVVADWEPRSTKKNSWLLTEQRGQIGTETNWVTMAGDLEGVVTLRGDGTLWHWKFHDDPVGNPNSAVATRLGAKSDWVGLVRLYNGALSLAADGGVWFWQFEQSGWNYVSSTSDAIFHPLLRVSRKPELVFNVFDKAD